MAIPLRLEAVAKYTEHRGCLCSIWAAEEEAGATAATRRGGLRAAVEAAAEVEPFS